MKKIIVDAFGGDNAPLEILKGCMSAVEHFDVEILLVGDEEKLLKCISENNIASKGMKIRHAGDILQMTDSPRSIMGSRSETSMAVGLKALAEGEGDAFVSAGSTGALVVGATMIIGRAAGVKRTAIGVVLPSADKPFLLIDSGANTECTADILESFAHLGNDYARKVMGISNPRIGLANIGVEATKGTRVLVETYKMLSESELNFIGNAEARDIPSGICDVVVCDGFTGNIILKTFEGTAGVIFNNLKTVFNKNFFTRFAALLLKKGLKDMKKKTDYAEQGGAPLLGFNKSVIKAHGSSNAKAFMNSIRVAAQSVID